MHGIGTINQMNAALPPSFRKGDKVKHIDFKGVILEVGYAVKDDKGNPGALVEFDDKGLIPPKMGIPYRFLKHLDDRPNPATHCPICKSPWKVTEGQRNVWQDCLKCDKTKESIMEEYSAKNL